MRIEPLQQALCSDRSQITAGPDPSIWITQALPEGWRLFSFHFFVKWGTAPLVVDDWIWMTRLVRLDRGERLATIEEGAVFGAFYTGPEYDFYETLEPICSAYGQRLSAILLPEVGVHEINDETPIWIVSKTSGEFRSYTTSVAKLKGRIRINSGGPVQVGSKGLIYGTSAVECALSRTDAAFPGDADAVIVDDQDRIRCIVEYKKHTLSDPIGYHLMTRYYPRPDGRKFQRLEALASRYRQGNRAVPLIILYYSTRAPIIRLQELGQLGASAATIARDSGDLSIAGQSPSEIANKVVRWLGIAT